MKQKNIKAECDLMYKVIEYANNKLTELRAICNHENTFDGNYSWRIGSINRATICSDCGQVIKMLDIPECVISSQNVQK